MSQADIISVPAPQPDIEPSKAAEGASRTEPASKGDNASCKEASAGENGSPGEMEGHGTAGKDGANGASAGNVAICVIQINGRLTLHISGGNASSGQDGTAKAICFVSSKSLQSRSFLCVM